MGSPLKLLLLLWCPCLVLGGYQVFVQTSDTPPAPGDTVSYTVVADPLPTTGPLLLVLIAVQGSDVNAPRAFTPWTLTMTFSPQQLTLKLPSQLAHSFYTIDVHQTNSVYSPLLASSTPFEIAPPAPPPPPPPPPPPSSKTTTTTTSATPTHLQPSPTPPAPVPPTSSSPAAGASVSSQSSSSASSASPNPPSLNAGSSSSVPFSSSSGSPPPSGTPGTSSSDTVTPAPHKSGGVMIGAVVGGVLVAILLLLLALFLCRRQRQRRAAREMRLEDNDVPSPYHPPMEQTSPSRSPFGDRQFMPNRRTQTQVSPFLPSDDGNSDPSISKNRERFATHVNNTSVTTSGYMDSMLSGGQPEQLRTERERLLGEISALRRSSGIHPSWSGSSAVGTDVSGQADYDGENSEIRTRLDQLTQHVQRLENALEHAAQVYDAPPVYNRSQTFL